MSLPTEFDFATLKIGDGAATEVFTISCGKQDINLNFGVNATDRYVRDCAKPGEIPFRKSKATGKQLDVTASGLTDATAFGNEVELLGTKNNIKVELYAEDGTDAGDLLGTIACRMMVRGLSIGTPRDGDSSAEIVLASEGSWTWTAAS
jgi:hypothetical protein